VSKRLHRWRPGLLVALFALAAQITFGAMAPDAASRPTPDQQLAALLADPGAICHGGAGDGQQTPHHHALDCLLCPYCAAIGTAAVLRSDDPTLPISRAGQIAVAVAVAAIIALPPPPLLAARPRGPPILA
jgi:hypothetical protein